MEVAPTTAVNVDEDRDCPENISVIFFLGRLPEDVDSRLLLFVALTGA